MSKSRAHNQCMSSIGKRVEALRKARDWSQSELARQSGVTQPSIWLIEKGKTKTVKVSTLDALCVALTTTRDYLLHGTDSGDSRESLQLAAMEAELIAILRGLPAERRVSLLEYARFIKTGAPVPAPAKPVKVEPLKRVHKRAS